jgi:hypothetical protein
MRDAGRNLSARRFVRRIHGQTLWENLEDSVGLAGQFEEYC